MAAMARLQRQRLDLIGVHREDLGDLGVRRRRDGARRAPARRATGAPRRTRHRWPAPCRALARAPPGSSSASAAAWPTRAGTQRGSACSAVSKVSAASLALCLSRNSSPQAVGMRGSAGASAAASWKAALARRGWSRADEAPGPRGRSTAASARRLRSATIACQSFAASSRAPHVAQHEAELERGVAGRRLGHLGFQPFARRLESAARGVGAGQGDAAGRGGAPAPPRAPRRRRTGLRRARARRHRSASRRSGWRRRCCRQPSARAPPAALERPALGRLLSRGDAAAADEDDQRKQPRNGPGKPRPARARARRSIHASHRRLLLLPRGGPVEKYSRPVEARGAYSTPGDLLDSPRC